MILSSGMGQIEKLMHRILSGTNDSNRISGPVRILIHLGFEMRIKGSHHVFRKQGIEDKPNLQKDGSKAKAYQVRQVRNIILKHKLGEIYE